MKLLAWIKKEIKHVFPVFLFFLICFTIINQVEMFLFLKAGISPTKFVEIALAAALIAKVVLAVDNMPFISLFSKKPLIWNIVWKSLNYWVFLLFSRFFIRFIPFAFSERKGMQNDFKIFFFNLDWNLFWAVQVFYLMFLFIYVAFDELTLKIGEDKMKDILFGKSKKR